MIEEFLLEFKVIIQVHHQMEEQELEKAMLEINYHAIRTLEHMHGFFLGALYVHAD